MNEENPIFSDQARKKACLWYLCSYLTMKNDTQEIFRKITEHENYSRLESFRMRLIGLPWFIIPDVILDVKKVSRKKMGLDTQSQNME